MVVARDVKVGPGEPRSWGKPWLALRVVVEGLIPPLEDRIPGNLFPDQEFDSHPRGLLLWVEEFDSSDP